MNRLKIATGIVLIFALGIFTGALGSGLYYKHRVKRFREAGPEERKELLLKKLTRRLDLTPKQQEEIAVIVDEMKEQLIAFRKTHQPDLERIREQGQAYIKDKLNEEQKKQFDEMVEKLKQRRGRMWHSFRNHEQSRGRKPPREP